MYIFTAYLSEFYCLSQEAELARERLAAVVEKHYRDYIELRINREMYVPEYRPQAAERLRVEALKLDQDDMKVIVRCFAQVKLYFVIMYE